LALTHRNFPRRQKELEHKLNNLILSPQVRLVGENIEPGLYPTIKAIEMAKEQGLDLVEISPNADPPVCRIVEYNKFLYEKKKREKEMKSKAIKQVMKEIRFTPNTDDHDFEFKTKHATNFLNEGSKVKAYVQFRGRAIVFKDRGELLLLKFVDRLKDIGVLEAMPKLEGNKMHVILNPKSSKSPKKPKEENQD
jgi:translation initiation factor IF-3